MLIPSALLAAGSGASVKFQQLRAQCHQQPESIDFSSEELRKKLPLGPPANFCGFVVFLLPPFFFFLSSFFLSISSAVLGEVQLPGKELSVQGRALTSSLPLNSLGFASSFLCNCNLPCWPVRQRPTIHSFLV